MLLFVNGIWWDDWILYDAKRNLIEWGLMCGRPTLGYFATLVRKLPHPETSIHILIFLSYYLSSVILFAILNKIDFLTKTDAFFISLLYSTLYVNEARITAVCFPYALSYIFFFLAFYLFIVWEDCSLSKASNLSMRILILFFFNSSFAANSFLVFYSILPMYIYYRTKNWRNYIKYADFFLLPVVFFTIKKLLWPTYGYYINYNKITLRGLITAFKDLVPGMLSSYSYPFSHSFPSFSIILFLIVIILLLDKVSRKPIINTETRPLHKTISKILLGVLFLALAIFPYLVVFSKTFLNNLDLYSFNTRHLLLVPIGASWITYFLLKHFIKNKKILTCTLLIICFFNMISWNKAYLTYQLLWYKQKSLTSLIKNEEFIKRNDTFIFTDTDKKAHDSPIYHFYALAGIFKRAFHDEKRLVLKQEDYTKLERFKQFFNDDYLLGEYTGDFEIDAKIILESQMALSDIPKLRIVEIFKQNYFERHLLLKNNITIISNSN